MGPVAVASDGIDLTVVRQDPEGMSKRPSWEGIRAVALMIDAEGSLVVGVGEVGKELLE